MSAEVAKQNERDHERPLPRLIFVSNVPRGANLQIKTHLKFKISYTWIFDEGGLEYSWDVLRYLSYCSSTKYFFFNGMAFF